MSNDSAFFDRAEYAPPGADEILAQIPGRARDIATLRGFGYTCLEIGRRFGISAQAVSATLARHHRRVGDFGAGSEMLELSARAANALARLGIERRGDVRGRDVFALLRRERNCGEKTLEEIHRWLERGTHE